MCVVFYFCGVKNVGNCVFFAFRNYFVNILCVFVFVVLCLILFFLLLFFIVLCVFLFFFVYVFIGIYYSG